MDVDMVDAQTDMVLNGDCMYSVIHILAVHRCSEDLTYLRATCRQVRVMVDRAWWHSQSRIVDRGLPCPRLRRTWKGVAQSASRITDAIENVTCYRASRVRTKFCHAGKIINHVAQHGGLTEWDAILMADPAKSSIMVAEGILAEHGRWDMLHSRSRTWNRMMGFDPGDPIPVPEVESEKCIWNGLARGGHIAMINTIRESSDHDDVPRLIAFAAAAAGNLELLQTVGYDLNASDRKSALHLLITNGHNDASLGFYLGSPLHMKREFCQDLKTVHDEILGSGFTVVIRLLLCHKFDKAAALLDYARLHRWSVRPSIHDLIIAKDQDAIRWYLYRWPRVITDESLFGAMHADSPEIMEMFLPVWNTLLIPEDQMRYHMIEVWMQWPKAIPEYNFYRWAPFWYMLCPMDEQDSHVFFNGCVVDPIEYRHKRPRLDVLIRSEMGYIVEWIKSNWTAENKIRYNAMDKWWMKP